MLFFLKDIISFFRLKCCGIEVTSVKPINKFYHNLKKIFNLREVFNKVQ
jgi:hypothetical protein